MTSAEQLHLRLEMEAKRQREAGNYAAAHDTQRHANEFARLASLAERLPAARRAPRPVRPKRA
jgi:maltooligosyltrehalose synthase